MCRIARSWWHLSQNNKLYFFPLRVLSFFHPFFPAPTTSSIFARVFFCSAGRPEHTFIYVGYLARNITVDLVCEYHEISKTLSILPFGTCRIALWLFVPSVRASKALTNDARRERVSSCKGFKWFAKKHFQKSTPFSPRIARPFYWRAVSCISGTFLSDS